MKQYLKYFLPAIISVFLCQSCELIADALSDDTETTKVIEIDDAVTKISFKSDLEIELIESSENTIKFTGAEALLDKLSIKNNSDSLTVTCDKFAGWSYDVPKVQLSLSSIREVYLYAYNELFASDTLYTPNIYVFSDGTGDIRLSVNSQSLKVSGTNISNFYINGKTDSLSISTIYGSAFYGSGLIAQHVEATNYGSNNHFIYPVKSLICNILYSGNIYYVNEPESIENNITGNGQVIFDASKK